MNSKLKLGIIALASASAVAAVTSAYNWHITNVINEVKAQATEASVSGRNWEAIKLWTQFIESRPNNAEAYYERGEYYGYLAFIGRGKENAKKAIEDYTKAIEIEPKNKDYYSSRGTVYYDYLNNYSEAFKDYSKAIALDPDDIGTYYIRARAYAGIKDYSNAIKDYTKAIALDPDNIDAYNTRAEFYANIGDYSNAIKDYTQIIALYSPDPEKKAALKGLMLDAVNSMPETESEMRIDIATFGKNNAAFQKARSAYQNVYAMNKVYLMRGHAYRGLNDYENAINDYKKVLEGGDYKKEAYANLAEIYIIQKDYLLASENAREACDMGDCKVLDSLREKNLLNEDIEWLFNRGVALGKLARFHDKIALYEEIDSRFGQDKTPDVRKWVALTLLSKGVTLGQLDKHDAAIAVYEEIERRFGQDKTPDMRRRVAAALLNKGITLSKQDKPDAEIAIYEEIERRFGQDKTPAIRDVAVNALFNKGVTLRDQGKPDAEIATYEEIERRFGQDDIPDVRTWVARTLFYKGVTLGKQGKNDAAIAVYKEIERRFAQDDSPDVSEVVAMARRNPAN
jgi:tetratricopeptide (TPR) repeat protein